MTPLPQVFLDRPIAHRALHWQGAPENSRAAVQAAIGAGYGIEIDLQLSADGQAMVFHDHTLDRLTPETGRVDARSAAALEAITLKGSDEGIPTLAEILALTAGRTPLLIEIKDQDGTLGPDVGRLEQATADALKTYDGPVALMSFNPHSMAAVAPLCPGLPLGLTTCAYDGPHWNRVPEARLNALKAIADAGRVGASFISHQHNDLHTPRVAALRAQGLHILCWTIRTPQEEAAARAVAHNVTFEGYDA